MINYIIQPIVVSNPTNTDFGKFLQNTLAVSSMDALFKALTPLKRQLSVHKNSDVIFKIEVELTKDEAAILFGLYYKLLQINSKT